MAQSHGQLSTENINIFPESMEQQIQNGVLLVRVDGSGPLTDKDVRVDVRGKV